MHCLRDISSKAAALLIAFGSLGVGGCEGGKKSFEVPRVQDLPPSKLVLSERRGRVKDYPCQDCHNKIVSGALLGAEPKKHTGMVFDHFSGVKQCLTCHDKENRNAFGLLNGEKVSFDDSHLLCGQCHMEKLNDWNIGAHGKHVGGWRGTKYRLECTDCHNPHAPAREPMIAEPAPPLPALAIPKGEHP